MVNTLLLILAWAIYLVSFWLHVRSRRMTIWMGLNIGIMHLVLVPFSVFAFKGGLSGDPGGVIPSVDWADNGPAVLRILTMIIAYGTWNLVRLLIQSTPPPIQDLDLEPSFWDSLQAVRVSHLIIVFVVAAFGLYLLASMGAGGGHWAHAKGEFLIAYGTPAILALSMVNAIRLTILIVLASLYFQDRIKLKRYLILMGIVCVVDLYTTGTRIFTLQTLVTTVALLMVRRQWFQFGMLSLAMIPFGILMTMFSLIRVYMHNWSGGGLSSAGAALNEGYLEAKDYFLPDLGIPEFLMGVSEGINANVLVVVVEDFHSMMGMLWGIGILRGFVFWIPRSLWPGKPENLTILIGRNLMGGDNTSMGATIFGEFWANFGLLGFAMIPVVMYCVNLLLRKTIRNPTMHTVAAFIFGYSVVRMPVSDFTVLFLFVILLLNITRLPSRSNGLLNQ